METKLLETEKKIDSKSLLALGLLMITGIAYQLLGSVLGEAIPNLVGMLFEASWNLVLCGIIGYYFLGKISLEQFKHFKFKTFLWGLPLVVIVGLGSGAIFNYIFEPATKNSVGEVISISMILFRVPFMLMGEELLCTNVIIALQKLRIEIWRGINNM